MSKTNITQKTSTINRSKFTVEEDLLLSQLVQQFGILNWNLIAHKMQARNPRQCQERWNNHLNPSINTSEWTPQEDDLLLKKYEEIGSKWVRVSKYFVNRTDIQCKNRIQKLKRRFNLCNKLMKEIENVPSLKTIKNEPKSQLKSEEPFSEEGDCLSPEATKITFDDPDFFNFDYQWNENDFSSIFE
jgi:hypothetical protein